MLLSGFQILFAISITFVNWIRFLRVSLSSWRILYRVGLFPKIFRVIAYFGHSKRMWGIVMGVAHLSHNFLGSFLIR